MKTPSTRRSSPFGRSPATTRGSLLIVAMMLTAIIGISLASYLRLSRTSLAISNRALYSNAAMNLAENGLEEAMYSINQMVEDPTYSWDGWTDLGVNARRKWTDTTFDQNATGEVRVFVYDYAGAAGPRILARSLVTLGGGAGAGAPIEKWIEVQLRKTSKFANGLVAKDSILFKGNNASVDSWSSRPVPDINPAAPSIAYSTLVKNDSGSIGSISVSADAVSVLNADIWGYASTGGALPTLGPNGLVGPFGTAAGTMDMSHISTDFAAGFDPVAQPTGGTTIPNISIAGSAGATTLPDVAGTTATYSLDSIFISGGSGNKLVIQGDVTLYVNNAAGTSAIDVTGGGIEIQSGASLKIYTAGNVAIGGGGVVNGSTTTNQPINFQLWGTSTSTVSDQNIAIAGNGVLSGIIYAPNGDVTINGNGEVMGSVVAESITVTGNAAFHYDESLANFGGGNPFRVSRWNELTTAAERDAADGDDVLGF